MTEEQQAIEYFINQGFIEELTTDKKYFVRILIKSVQEKSKINLNFTENDITNMLNKLPTDDNNKLFTVWNYNNIEVNIYVGPEK